ncbi:MAG: lysophospholipid acyltransferase family protein [Candidatus Omnitrophota bacterium]
MIHWVSRLLCFLFFKIMCRLDVKGKENIPRQGGFIIAANHVSFLDPLALGSSCPRALSYMARHDLFSHRVLRWWLSHVHVFPVKRESADLSAIKEAMKRVKGNMGLLLFPEGTRQSQGQAGPVQPGIGFLAAKLDCPVIPAFIKGSEEALPKGAKFIKPAKITVCFGQQILIERRMPYQEIAQRIMAGIRHLSC